MRALLEGEAVKVGDVYLCGLGVYQPPVHNAGEAARSGLYDRSSYLENRLTGVCVAGDVSPPEMAVHAARHALERAALDPARIGLLMHASVFLQGPEMWLPAYYVQREVVGSAIPAFEIRLGCNGIFAALELAAPRMASLPEGETVLVTTAENLESPLLDRWNGAPGFLQADAGSALVLRREPGFARLLAVASAAAPELEKMHRGAEPLFPPGATAGTRIDMRERALHFRDTVMPLADAAELAGKVLTGLVDQVLGEAGRSLDQMTRVVYANTAGYYLEQQVLIPLGIPVERTTWQYGRGIGHTGCSDQLLSLNHLLVTGALAPGDHVLLIGAAPGFTLSGAVLEIREIPAWAR